MKKLFFFLMVAIFAQHNSFAVKTNEPNSLSELKDLVNKNIPLVVKLCKETPVRENFTKTNVLELLQPIADLGKKVAKEHYKLSDATIKSYDDGIWVSASISIVLNEFGDVKGLGEGGSDLTTKSGDVYWDCLKEALGIVLVTKIGQWSLEGLLVKTAQLAKVVSKYIGVIGAAWAIYDYILCINR